MAMEEGCQNQHQLTLLGQVRLLHAITQQVFQDNEVKKVKYIMNWTFSLPDSMSQMWFLIKQHTHTHTNYHLQVHNHAV